MNLFRLIQRVFRGARKLQLLCKDYKSSFATLALIVFSLQALELAAAYQFGNLIGGIGRSSTRWLCFDAGMIALTIVLAKLCTLLRLRFFYREIGFPMERTMGIQALEKVKSLTIGQVVSKDLNKVHETVKSGQQAARKVVHAAFTGLLPIAFTLVLVIACLFAKHWALGSVALVGFLAIIDASVRLTDRTAAGLAQHTEDGSKIDSKYLDLLRLFRLVKVSNQEAAEIESIDRDIVRCSRQGVAVWTKFFDLCFATKNVLEACTVAALLLTAIMLRSRSAIQTADVVDVAVWTWCLLNLMGSLDHTQRTIMQGKAPIERYLAFLDIEPEFSGHAVMSRGRIQNLEGDIVFENVWFRNLKGVSLKIQDGQLTGIVGPSGAGKSSIMNLALGIYYPERGRVLVNGIDTREVDQGQLLRRVGFVPQSPEFFSDTVRRAITYGLGEAACMVSDEEIKCFANKMGLEPFLKRHGLDAIVGPFGIEMSGGERQRLALARALITRPKILALDEHTSGLDRVSEMFVRRIVTDFSRDNMTIVIAHKLDTIKKANSIVVVHDGRIAGQGTHYELYKHCDEYRRLVNSQSIEAVVGV